MTKRNVFEMQLLLPFLKPKERPKYPAIIFGSSFTTGFCDLEKEPKASQNSHITLFLT